VVILAAITAWYAWSANRQASAAESQAKAASKQAEAAERTLAHLQSQIDEQTSIALATLLGSVTELREAAAHWHQQIIRPMPLDETIEVNLLPPQWVASLERARKISPVLFERLQSLQRSSRDVSRSIRQYCATMPPNRSGGEPGRIQEQLQKVDHDCVDVWNGIARLLPPEHVNAAVGNI